MKVQVHSPPNVTGLPVEDPVSLLPETAEQAAEWITALKRLLLLAERLDADGNLKDKPDGS